MSSPSVREGREALERQTLSPLAAFSDAAVRDLPEEPCTVRPAYQRDGSAPRRLRRGH